VSRNHFRVERRTVKRKKLLLMMALAVVALGLGAFALMAAKDRTYVTSARYSPQDEPNADVAVVY
jgi:hypothetical protein